MDERREKKLSRLPLLTPITLISRLDEIILEALPDQYRSAAEHYINAKVEMLKAVSELIDLRIKELKEIEDSWKSNVKKEKVELE